LNESVLASGSSLATRRLDLRPLDDSDVDLLFAFNSGTETLRYVARDPWTERSQAEEKLDAFLSAAGRGEAVWWVIVDRITGRKSGYAGLFDLDRAAGKAEIGYGLVPASWGRRVAGEAVAAIVAWADAELDLHRIHARVHPGNTASERILEKLGFAREGVLRHDAFARGRYFDSIVFGRINPRHR
jgi:RimJ/RimL family protein N-acetyltransferase